MTKQRNEDKMRFRPRLHEGRYITVREQVRAQINGWLYARRLMESPRKPIVY